MTKKRPLANFNPNSEKKPRIVEAVDKGEEDYIAWHIRILDRGGPWCWTSIDAATLWETLHTKLSAFETMKWGEILGDKNHPVPLFALPPDTRKRLKEIKQDDVDSLISLRLDGKKRIWGIRNRNILKILWWDPEHQVCPSHKRHT